MVRILQIAPIVRFAREFCYPIKMVAINSRWIEDEKAAERQRLADERAKVARREKAEKAFGRSIDDDLYEALQDAPSLSAIYLIASSDDALSVWSTRCLRLLHALTKTGLTQAYFLRQMTDLRDTTVGRYVPKRQVRK